MKRSAERVAPVAQTTHPTRAGLAWVLNSLCGATLSATREFATGAWVLNSLVVQHFLRRGNLRGCSTRLWCNTFCDAGIGNGCVGAQFTLFGGLFYFAVPSCTLVKWNSRASNKPRSLNFSAGMGRSARKLSVMNGALNVAPTSRVMASYLAPTSSAG